MDIASSIRAVGFRKWYERQLIDSHAALVTCILCAATVAICLEEMYSAGLGLRPLLLAVVFGGLALAWYSGRRYFLVLQRAEVYGSRSSCPACKTYARFDIIASGSMAEGPYLDPVQADLAYPWLRVRCRKCGTGWRMPD